MVMKMKIPVKKICCVGAGYVGGPTSAMIALKVPSVDVTVVDKDASRIASWNSEKLPFSEPGLYDVVQTARNGNQSLSNHRPNLFFSTDVEGKIREADMIFVAVETPPGVRDSQGGAPPDLKSFHAVIRKIGEIAEQDFILINKSTVSCGAADEVRQILAPIVRPGIQFEVLSNPEFMAEGTAVRDLLEPDRILIGSLDSDTGLAAAGVLAELYAQWVPRERIITMSCQSAELSKLAANMLLAQRISSINMLSALSEELGADITEVSRAVGLDHRIGQHMLRATLGFGGSCFRKDVMHLTHTAASLGLHEPAVYLKGILSMNEYQTHRFTESIVTHIALSTGPKIIGILGFAFKSGTDDTRESPAIRVVSDLITLGYSVKIFDPLVSRQKILHDLKNVLIDSENCMKQGVSVCSTVYEACTDAHAVAILNEWSALRYAPQRVPVQQVLEKGKQSGRDEPNGCKDGHSTEKAEQVQWTQVAELMQAPRFIFDGHNILDPAVASLGFTVFGVGRRGDVETGSEKTPSTEGNNSPPCSSPAGFYAIPTEESNKMRLAEMDAIVQDASFTSDTTENWI